LSRQGSLLCVAQPADAGQPEGTNDRLKLADDYTGYGPDNDIARRDDLVKAIWVFTISYPTRHRDFTPRISVLNILALPVDEHLVRSYEGGTSAAPHVAGASVDGRRPGSAYTQPLSAQRTLTYGNLEIRPDEIQALADGRRVGLTVREFQVLLVLAKREDRVVRRADIYGEVWGGEMKRRDRSVDVFVRKVRNKLARCAPDWTYIHTHFGVGYRFAAVPVEPGSVETESAPAPTGFGSPPEPAPA
jgi:DNA-binding winged helix-turn-helix (wHTH) protein